MGWGRGGQGHRGSCLSAGQCPLQIFFSCFKFGVLWVFLITSYSFEVNFLNSCLFLKVVSDAF